MKLLNNNIITKLQSSISIIPIADISYIEKVKGTKYLHIVTINNMYKSKSTLKKTIAILSNYGFVNVNRSIIVNTRNLVEISAKSIPFLNFKGNIQIYISVNSAKKMIKYIKDC
ncbi:hypothetical protein AN1V17_42940 [Vallitalea sediminicola]